MGDRLCVRARGGACVAEGINAADLARLLIELERSLRLLVYETAGAQLVVTRMHQAAGAIELELAAPQPAGDESCASPFSIVMEALTSYAETARPRRWSASRLAWGLPPGIRALEFRYGAATATLKNESPYRSAAEWDEYQRRLQEISRSTVGPYQPLPEHLRLDFDVEEFNREVAEARAADRDWWEES